MFSIQPEILVCISVIGRAFLKFLEKSTNLQGIPCKVLEMSYQELLFHLTMIFHLSGNLPGNF